MAGNRSLGSLTLDLIAKIGGFITGMTQAERIANQKMSAIEKRAYAFGRAIGGSIRNAAGNLVGFAAGFASIQAAISGLNNAIDAADRVDELSARLGISTEQLSAWGYAAKLSGTDIESIASAIPKLSKNLAAALDSGDKFADIFKALQIDVRDGNKQLRQVDDVLPEIADAFKNLDNETLKAALALELFGKSGAELLEFLSRGSDGLEELENRARSLGIVIDGDTAAGAAAFKDEIDNLKAASQGLFTQLAGELLPQLKALTEGLTNIVKEGRKAGDIADVISNSFQAMGFIFSQAGNRLDGFGQIIEGVVSGIVALNGASRQLINGEFKGALNALTGSDAEAQIGQGAARLITGAAGKVKSEVSALATDIRKQFDEALKPVDKADKGLEDRLSRLFAGGDSEKKAKKKNGKSDAEKEAEALAKAYESTNEKLKEQIALFGKDGEAAALRYELENGALAKLDPLKKAELVTLAEKLDLMRDEAEVQKELDSQNEAREKSAKSVLDSIKEERETLGLSSEQWEIYNNLKRAGVDANTALGQSIIEETKALQAEAKALEPQIELMDSFREGLEDSVVGIINGATSIKDAFKDLFDDLAAQITRWIARRLIEQAFGAQGTVGGGSSGGWIGNLLGAFFGGGRAAGGVVSAGGMYRVNENWNRGPELLSFGNRDYLMMGSQGGRVSPAGSSGGATFGPTTIVVQGSATRETIRQIDRANGRRSTRELARTGR